MSKPSWTEQLDQMTASITKAPESNRLAFVGIGNELSGDDAAGVLIVQKLHLALSHRSDLLFIEGGLAPENFTSLIRKFEPHELLLIDTANMGGDPGGIEVFDMDELDGLSYSTHTLPPSILAEYLVSACACNVKLLGIQPISTGIGEPMSQGVTEAIDKVIRYFSSCLN